MYEALCRPSGTPLDIVHAKGGPPITQRTSGLGGTAMDATGNIYLEDLKNDSILKLSPERQITTVIQDHRLHWVDAPWIFNGFL